MASPLSLAAQHSITHSHFGRENQPLLTVDNALEDPEAVVAIAARHSYRPMGEFYPGIRAGVSEKIAMPLVLPILDTVREAFGLERAPRFRECFLSVVTKAPHELAPIQRLPHFDGTERERLAVLLYLDRERRGGTAFYRQRSTGFESVDESRFEQYRSELSDAVARHGLPSGGYISGDTEIFEQVHQVPDRFNSMVIYRSNTLHCALLDEGFTPDPDPTSGRLTLNLFLD